MMLLTVFQTFHDEIMVSGVKLTAYNCLGKEGCMYPFLDGILPDIRFVDATLESFLHGILAEGTFMVLIVPYFFFELFR